MLIKHNKQPKLQKPTANEVKQYLKLWDSLGHYVQQESALLKLFTKTYPKNTDLDDVLIKVCALNDFYSTNIFSPFAVAKHIVELDIDDRLISGDASLVNEVALVTINDKATKNFYSFATKYCSHHRPVDFPIYDSYVEKVLVHFRNKDQFYDFHIDDLKNYEKFKNILIEFRKFYGLTQFDLKQIDKYLWQLGKKHFLRKY